MWKFDLEKYLIKIIDIGQFLIKNNVLSSSNNTNN